MEKWCVEFELICEIMSKEIKKRKEIRIEMNKLYENVEKLDRMYERSENPVERGHMAAEIVEIQDKLEQLEIEYDMANYMVKRLKEERRAVLEKQEKIIKLEVEKSSWMYYNNIVSEKIKNGSVLVWKI